MDVAALAGYAWLGIPGTLLAYVLWFQGVARLPVAAMSLLVLLAPAVAISLGWLVPGQILTAVQTVGFGLALLAIAAAQLDPGACTGSSTDVRNSCNRINRNTRGVGNHANDRVRSDRFLP